MSEGADADKPLSILQMLDALIRRYYHALNKKNESNVKIGDFLKMIEVRRKLAPVDADQREFWNMLEKVRKEAMDDPKKPTARKKKRARDANEKAP